MNEQGETTGQAAASVQRPESFDEKAARVNAMIAYSHWAVFTVDRDLPVNDAERDAIVDEAITALSEIEGLNVRGFYDVSGFRAEADLMAWWYAERPETVQLAYHRLLATRLGRHLRPYWSNVALHRQAEFNPRHIPAFLAGERAHDYLCVYPFVRSYEWYLLPPEERSAILREHGQYAVDYPDVRANTIASFALGDYEWILAFEADELHRIVDLMRHMRGTKARLHVREETPFFTGPRVDLHNWARLVATGR
ncbi:MAG: Chlorite dismutase family protein [Pseudoclavibacter caeni]|jgi:hydrogen peroxide-dependent heme synthase